MNIAITLQHLFPDSTPRVDWLVVDDGSGPVIAEWNLPETQPTQTQLNAAWSAANSGNLWSLARGIRKPLLEASDWTQLEDVPLTTEQKESWRTYRQSLRDITTQANPATVSWPTPPE